MTDGIAYSIAPIERLNAHLNAVVVRDFDRARDAAKAMDNTPVEQRGVLGGLPITIKESHNIAGLPIGLQAVSAEYNDYLTIDFCRLLANEIGGFKAPAMEFAQ